MMMTMLSAAMLLISAPEPTTNGDPIGVASRDHAGRITLQLRSVQCDGILAEGLIKVAPKDADYAKTLRWLGGIKPGETKMIVARDLQPCPKR